ncbi:hypothetical protein QN239_31585 [Mycolicibacterium sp. Y3]
MNIQIVDAVRTKTAAQWCQIVDSHYEARNSDGYVRHPNWVVHATCVDADGEFAGQGEIVDIVPALPDEIPPPHPTIPRHLANHPIDTRPVAARLGYPNDHYEFQLDFTGAYTAAFIREHRSSR